MPLGSIAGRWDRQRRNPMSMYSPTELAQLRGEMNEDAMDEEEHEDDGQPDEQQEWADFDPDC